MSKKPKKVNIQKIDLLYLKKKGLSNDKISKMLGVERKEIDKYIELQHRYRQNSGVY